MFLCFLAVPHLSLMLSPRTLPLASPSRPSCLTQFTHVSPSLLTVSHFILLTVTRRCMEYVSLCPWAGCWGPGGRLPALAPLGQYLTFCSSLLAAIFPSVPGARLHGGAGPLLWRRDRLCPGVSALAGRSVPRHQGECAVASRPVEPAGLTPGGWASARRPTLPPRAALTVGCSRIPLGRLAVPHPAVPRASPSLWWTRPSVWVTRGR